MNKRASNLLALMALCATSGCTCQKPEESAPQTKMEQTTQENKQITQETKTMAQPQRTTTSSGLQYEVMKSPDANAKKPATGNTVTVHYTGWLADANGNPRLDKEFDSSRKRNQPFQFIIGVGQVIKGWDEGVSDMKVGERRLLIIPANLAYGNRAVGGDLIPANSTLVFDVELIDTK